MSLFLFQWNKSSTFYNFISIYFTKYFISIFTSTFTFCQVMKLLKLSFSLQDIVPIGDSYIKTNLNYWLTKESYKKCYRVINFSTIIYIIFTDFASSLFMWGFFSIASLMNGTPRCNPNPVPMIGLSYAVPILSTKPKYLSRCLKINNSILNWTFL